MNGEWISTTKDYLPDFREFGFHTNKTVDIKFSDGTIKENVIYQGWGLFDKEDFSVDTVEFWREHKKEKNNDSDSAN